MSPLLVLGTKMYALPTNWRMKVMRFVHTTWVCGVISGMEFVGEREREKEIREKKTATRTHRFARNIG